MKKLTILFCLGIVMAKGQNYNTELLSNIRFPDNAANIWGYADSSKREYAIIGRTTGTSIFDVTDGKKPVLLKHIAGANSSWREIKSWKNRLYVVADRGADGVLIINMAKAPQEITSVFWKPIVTVDDKVLNVKKAGTIDRSHDLFIDEKGFCYLTGSSFHQGVVVLDLNTNPDNPVFKGIFNSNYTHDGFARRDTFWSADIIAGEFTVWDVRDKLSPKKLASQRTGNAFTHNIWLSDDGRYAFTTDERANAFVESYKVDDLFNITLLDKYRSRTTQIRSTIPHNTLYHNGFLVTSYYTDGFTIVDASDPGHLVEVGAFDTYPAGDGDFHGCWGVYPYLPSGNILASDIEFGLFVVKPTYVKANYLKGLVSDSITKLPLADAIIKIEKESNLEVQTKNDGSFKTGGPYTGKIKITISKIGYQTKSMDVMFAQGSVADIKIDLVPLKISVLQVRLIDRITKLPVAGQVVLQRPKEFLQFNTNADGFASNTVFEGEWDLICGSWGWKYAVQKVTLTVSVNKNIVVELNQGYEDQFIFDFGWSANSSANSGIWGRAEPIGTYLGDMTINPEFDLSDDLGNQCMITGNGSTAVSGADVDNGFTRLVSPTINLAPFQSPILSFYAWTARFNLLDSLIKIGTQKVFIVFGRDTVLIDSLSPNSLAWKKYSYKLDNKKFSNLTDIRIIFEAFEPAGTDSRNILEFGIDAFSIAEQSTTPVAGISGTAKFNVYPNPTNGVFNINTDGKLYDRKIIIYNQLGQTVSSINLPRGVENLNVNEVLSPGLYFLCLVDKNGSAQVTRKITISK